MARKVIIGDIHGCFNELQRLLDLIGPGKKDELIPLGDLVDGGPDSPAVVQFFMDLKSDPLSGNHEKDHVWQAGLPKNERNLSETKKRTLRQFRKAYRKGRVSITYEDAIEYFTKLPKYRVLDEAILVHAGIRYGVPFHQQENTLLGFGGAKNGCNGKGKCKTGGLPAWAYEYPEHEKPVLFGHRSILQEVAAKWVFPQRKNLWPLDTKCVCGGFLTAVTLPDFKVYQVKSYEGLRT